MVWLICQGCVVFGRLGTADRGKTTVTPKTNFEFISDICARRRNFRLHRLSLMPALPQPSYASGCCLIAAR